jgi:hypothetical protein
MSFGQFRPDRLAEWPPRLFASGRLTRAIGAANA